MYSNDNFLAHHGIKGQKWGIRRFQNPDGTRTALGKKRERSDRDSQKTKRNLKRIGAGIAGTATAIGTGFGLKKASEHIDRNKLFDQTIPGGKDKPKMSPAEKMSREASNIGSNVKSVYRTAKKVKNLKNGRESKTLTDQELRDRINRLNLEKQYETLIEEDYNRGHLTADDILNTVGSVITIGGSVATMIAVGKMIKK